MTLYDKIQEASSYIKSQFTETPICGVILGSGLGGLVDFVDVKMRIPYASIPYFPQSSVLGHAGELVLGYLEGKPVVLCNGRFHYYEGYDMETIIFPVRVMKALGVETLVVSNAAGAMHPDYRVGDIVIIKDHINLFPEHPLRGQNDDRLGVRFPDMSEPYALTLIDKAVDIAGELGIPVHKGVYVGLQGPTFETRAEYVYLRNIGGDVVGMSTVPEVIVAIHSQMRVFGASIVTDLGLTETLEKITHEEVLKAANEAAPKLAKIVQRLISSF